MIINNADIKGMILQAPRYWGPAQTFSITSYANVNEGSNLTVTVNTNNVPDGSLFYWTLTNSGDFVVAAGSIIVNSNTASFVVQTLADQTTEGTETFYIQLRTDNVDGEIVGVSSPNYILDTSGDPPIATYNLVGGGGGGGTTINWGPGGGGGGGGGGEFLEVSNFCFSLSTYYPFCVGNGGCGGRCIAGIGTFRGSPGTFSCFNVSCAAGGSGGGGSYNNSTTGDSGVVGGGGAGCNTGGAGTTGRGFSGGDGSSSGPPFFGGGGGGAGSNGLAGNVNVGGNGGNGVMSNITNEFYGAGGGGGGISAPTQGNFGLGTFIGRGGCGNSCTSGCPGCGGAVIFKIPDYYQMSLCNPASHTLAVSNISGYRIYCITNLNQIGAGTGLGKLCFS